MRYLFYYYSYDVLVIKYHDDYGKRISHRYYYFTVKEAIRKFRIDNGLQHKHIVVKKLA